MLKGLLGMEAASEGKGCHKLPEPSSSTCGILYLLFGEPRAEQLGILVSPPATGGSPSWREARISPLLLCLTIKQLS